MIYHDIGHLKAEMNKLACYGKKFLFIINFEMTEGYLIEDPMEQQNILFEIGEKRNNHLNSQPPAYRKIRLDIFPSGEKEYKEKFDIVHKGLNRGDSFLANLTLKTRIDTNLSLIDIFERSKAPYKLYVPGRFVCFSPERFIKISDKIISTNPMKGTISADIPDAEQIILSDFKETAEHNTIVDLLRNDLSIVSDNVKVKQFRYIDHIKTQTHNLLQVSSEITGTLKHGYHRQIADIIFGMLPAGSICGAPKAATVRLIQQAENEPRGYYTGIFGYFDGKDLDSGVLIRYIELDGNQLFYRSGGGITAYSNWESEYEEVLNKIYLPFV